MKYFMVLISLCLLAFPLTGCTEDEVTLNAYKTLKTCSTTYDAGMQAVSEAQVRGLIGEEARADINRQAHVFLAAFRTAAGALYAYEGSKAKDDTALIEAVLACRDAIRDFIGFLDGYGIAVPEAKAVQHEQP